MHVVINGSREYLPRTREQFAQLRVIALEVSAAVVRERLEKRGRESAEEIEARIAHNQQMPMIEHPHLQMLNDDEPLAETGARFIELIKEYT